MLLRVGLFATLFSAASYVSAHGWVQQIDIDSPENSYPGYLPSSDPYQDPVPDRIVRKIPGNGPVTDLSLIDIQCNGDANAGFATEPAALYTEVAAGSDVHLTWTAWPDTHIGPVITYMALAPESTNITEWMPGDDEVWFKIDEAGKTADGKWAATDLLAATDYVYTFTIPESLKPGQYIIRHEIIALHAATSYPGAQVYPSCIQVEVTGSGSAFPDSFVSFPGAYTRDTPGIVYDAYTNTGDYPIPGPAVWVGN